MERNCFAACFLMVVCFRSCDCDILKEKDVELHLGVRVDKSLSIDHWKPKNNNETCAADAIFCVVKHNVSSQARQQKQLPSLELRRLIESVPVHALTSGTITNKQCRKDSKLFLQAIKDFQLWALKMHDASAKIPSGLLNGNVNQFGDFDQCLSVGKQVDDPITGRYCLAYLDLQLKSDAGVPSTLRQIDSLLHSYNVIVSKFDDPGHRIPRFSTISWGLCIPSSCSSADLEQYLTEMLEPVNNKTELQFSVRVEPKMCYVQDEKPVTLTSKFVMLFFFSIFCATLVGTYYDYKSSSNGGVERLLKCFSIKRNWGSLVKTDTPQDDIKTVHGLRAINAIALILFHKSVAFQFNPFVNRTRMQEILSMPWSVIGRTSIVYTDSFIMFSGLLTSYSFIKELDEKKKLNLWDKYFSRYVRPSTTANGHLGTFTIQLREGYWIGIVITPNLLAIILFCTYISGHLGSGPQWNLVVQHHADICQKTMWRNFLYIHNYFGFENMCLTHTHQLGIDMQLFLVSPLLIYVLWKNVLLGMALLFGLGTWSTCLRYSTMYDNKLSTVVYSGISVSQLFETANLSYILPTHRATVYIIGIAMGYVLRKMPKIKMNMLQVVIGWIIAAFLGLLAMCGPFHMVNREYQYDPRDSAIFNAWSPIVWSGFLIWAILCSEQGYGGFIRDILRWRGFVVFTRIAYAVYLTQFPVFFYNVGTTRNSQYYTPNIMFDMGEVACIFIVSIAMTLMFDLPSQEIKKEFWSKNKKVCEKERLEYDPKDKNTSPRT